MNRTIKTTAEKDIQILILSLTLGRQTGFVIGSVGLSVSGVWNLNGHASEEYLKSRLDQLHAAYPPEEVAILGSKRSLASSYAIVAAWCRDKHVPLITIEKGDVRFAWAGRKSATDQEMMAEAKRRNRGMASGSIAEVDAVATHFFRLDKMAIAA